MSVRSFITTAALVAAVASGAALNAANSQNEVPPVVVAAGSSSSSAVAVAGAATTVPVEVYAGDFIAMHSHPLKNHGIKVYIDTFDDSKAQLMTTDSTGFLTFQAPVGSKVFLTCVAANDFHETTTAISTVPAGGMTGTMGRIVLQVPSNFIFGLFKLIIGRPAPSTHCQVVVTITQFGKTYTDDPQGYPGVQATIDPASDAMGEERAYYFGTMLNNKTNPLPNNRTSTSWDGGVVFPAIPVNTGADAIIGGHYEDFPFSTSRIRCMRPGQFINAAPNQGPRALKPLTGQ